MASRFQREIMSGQNRLSAPKYGTVAQWQVHLIVDQAYAGSSPVGVAHIICGCRLIIRPLVANQKNVGVNPTIRSNLKKELYD